MVPSTKASPVSQPRRCAEEHGHAVPLARRQHEAIQLNEALYTSLVLQPEPLNITSHTGTYNKVVGQTQFGGLAPGTNAIAWSADNDPRKRGESNSLAVVENYFGEFHVCIPWIA